MIEERQSRGEFLALMAAGSATAAIAIDAMLPAFAMVREHFGLGATAADAALIITVFILGLGVGQLVYGPFADRFGRKPVFIAGLLLYVVAGFATTFAPTLPLLLVGRFLWGLGAAGPRVVSQAMLRDRYRGNELARAMAIILTVFLIVPTLAPLLGQAALQLGSWRYTFAIGPVFGVFVAIWATRVTESLEPSMRRSLDPASVVRNIGEVLRTRTALGNMLALMLLTAAFLPYLGSSERLYTEVYGRGSQFFLWFAASSVVMAGFTLATSRLVGRLGTTRMTMGVFTALVLVATAFVIVTLATAGTPSFAVFVVSTILLISLTTALTPLLTSRALEDVGHIAGTAASTIGAVGFIGGALLAPFVDRAIDTTVTPFAVGYLVFGVVAAGAAAWAGTSQTTTEASLVA